MNNEFTPQDNNIQPTQPQAPVQTPQFEAQPQAPVQTPQFEAQPQAPVQTPQFEAQPQALVQTPQFEAQPQAPVQTPQFEAQPQAPVQTPQFEAQPQAPVQTPQFEAQPQAPVQTPQFEAQPQAPVQTPQFSVQQPPQQNGGWSASQQNHGNYRTQNTWGNAPQNNNNYYAQNNSQQSNGAGWNSSTVFTASPTTPYEVEQLKNKFFKRACNIAAGSSLFMILGQAVITAIISYIIAVILGIYYGVQYGGSVYMMEDNLLMMLQSPALLYGVTVVGTALGNSIGILYGAAKMKLKMKELFTKSTASFTDLVVLCIMALGVNTLASYIVTFLDVLLDPIGLSVPTTSLITEITDPIATVFLFIVVVIIAPITEEILFRGVILKVLSKYSTVFAAVASSLLFGLIHMNIPQAVFAFMVGIIMSYITIKTGSIKPAIYIHAFNNFFAISSQILIAYNIAPKVVNIAYTVISLACLAATVVILIVKAKKISFKSDNLELRQAENFIAISNKWGKFFSSGWVIVFIVITILAIIWTVVSSALLY